MKDEDKVTLSEIVKLIHNTGGEEFKVEFTKRNSTTKRKMKCVLNDNSTENMPYDPSSKQLISVFDTEKDAYRVINISGIISVKINGQLYKVK